MSGGTRREAGRKATSPPAEPAPASSPADPAARRDHVTALIAEVSRGNRTRVGDLVEALYPELHRLAAGYMRRERPGQTIQATALIHDCYLRLARDRRLAFQNRAHFFAIAANAMRQILVERARARRAAKRGGGADRVTLVEAVAGAPPAPVDAIDLLALHEALDRLALLDPKRARLVELRYFGGLTIEEAAEALDLSPATVKRTWSLARAWLRRELHAHP